MPAGNRGQTPEGFRHQLLQRLRNQALQHGVPASRLQQQVAFERLLARLPVDGEWILKGGFALQLRYGLVARPTRDIDLRTLYHPSDALDRLRRLLGRSTVADNFSFELSETVQEFQGAPGGSIRVKVQARIGGVRFVDFDLDLSSGDALSGAPDQLRGSDILHFAAIAPIEFPSYPITQHLAEKFHALYAAACSGEYAREDLVDLVYLAATEVVAADWVREAVNATFQVRATHPVPGEFPSAPSSWEKPFAAIAATVHLTVRGLVEGQRLAAKFWNPLLLGMTAEKSWVPDQQAWLTARPLNLSDQPMQDPPTPCLAVDCDRSIHAGRLLIALRDAADHVAVRNPQEIADFLGQWL